METQDMVMEDLPSGYSYLFSNSNSSNESVIRIKEVSDQSSAEAWLNRYMDHTKTTWRKAATYPNSGKVNIFRVDLRCVHLTDKRVKGVRSSKNTDCPAKLNIIIKRYRAHPRGKSKDALLPDWPSVVCFKATHNHYINSAAALKYRDMSDEVKEKLKTLFRKGHSPASSLHCIKTDLLIENSENYYELAADTYYVPSISVVHKFFEKEFVEEYGSYSGDKMIENLALKLQEYSKESHEGTARIFKSKYDNHYFVVLCTPIMARTHRNISQCRELVMVDASGGMDKQRHRVYFFITPTVAGGLPVGVIITDSERECVFDEALAEFRNILPKDSFFKQNYPTVFLTDNDLKERKPLKKNFPKSVLLLCQFHFLKACWTWICNCKHNILKTHRQELYFLIKNVVYAVTEDEALKHHDILLSNQISKTYPSFQTYYFDLWKRKEDWATCYRQKFLLRGSNTTNYNEVVFRIMKDCILNRVMAFNLAQLVDYIMTRYEMYLEKRLIDFVNGRYPTSMLIKMLPKKTDGVPHEIEKFPEFDNVFQVTSAKSQDKYLVDISSGTCSCINGQTGNLCSHASSVILHLENYIEAGFNLVTDKSKSLMYFIATGNNCSKDWLKPLQCLPDKTNPESESKYYNNVDTSNNILTEINTESSDSIQLLENKHELTTNEKENFKNLITRINAGIEKEPNIYVPAVKKMLENANKFASTETGLISALHTFGTYRGLLPTRTKQKQPRRKHSSLIGVQPTAIGRRKNCITGKRRLSAGRPRQGLKICDSLKDHQYTNFNSLPLKKRTPHSLQTAVYLNKSVGSTKSRKT